jgi:hypothetical protein
MNAVPCAAAVLASTSWSYRTLFPRFLPLTVRSQVEHMVSSYRFSKAGPNCSRRDLSPNSVGRKSALLQGAE